MNGKQNPHETQVMSPTTPEDPKPASSNGLNKRAVMAILSTLAVIFMLTYMIQSKGKKSEEKAVPADTDGNLQSQVPDKDAALAKAKQDILRAQRQEEAKLRQAKLDAARQKQLEALRLVPVPIAAGPAPVTQASAGGPQAVGATTDPENPWERARLSYRAGVAQKYYAERAARDDERIQARRAEMFYMGGNMKPPGMGLTSSAAKSGTGGQSSSQSDDDILLSLRQMQAQNEKNLARAQNQALNNGQGFGQTPGSSAQPLGPTPEQKVGAIASNDPSGKLAFYANGQAQSPSKGSNRMMAQSTYVRMGTVVRAVLYTGLDSQLPGMVFAQVYTPVWSADMSRILIPSGTRLVGAYNSNTTAAQTRVQIAWSDMLLPNGLHLKLPNFPGVDLTGSTGYVAQVNNHWDKLLIGSGFAAVISASAAALGGTTNQLQVNPVQQALLGGATPVQEAGAGLAKKYADVDPTLTLKAGGVVGIMLTQNLVVTTGGF